MIISMTLAAVALVMVTVILALGVRLNTSTTRERRWQLALQAAESGVEASVTNLRSNATYAGTASPQSLPAGEFEVKVTNVGNAKQIDAIGYVPSKTAANALKRRLRVVYSPEPSFKYALFSNTSLFVKNNSIIAGDVFANEDVVVDANAVITGSVTSSTGSVLVGGGSRIKKDGNGEGGHVTTGGFQSAARWAMSMANSSSTVEGDVNIRVEDVCTTVIGGIQSYNLDNIGTIGGTVRMPAAANATRAAALAAPGKRVDECLQREGKSEMPSFTYDEANYAGIQRITVAQWNSTMTGAISGNYYVEADASGTALDLTNRTIVGDTVIISEPKVRQGNSGANLFDTTPSSATVQIIVLDASTDPANPSFKVENHFDTPLPPSPAVLVYSRGFCSMKNNGRFNGAIYCNGLELKNNLGDSYDERIRHLLGFGDAKLIRSSFLELTSNTPL